jgi:hypothetical protein
MKTYIQLHIGTRGTNLIKLVKKIEGIGFTSSLGEYDFEYNWESDPTKEQVLSMGTKIIWALTETGSTFRMVTK